MQTNPESAAVEAVAWLVTNGGETCEPWLVYERNEVEALPASCIADPLYPQSALDALRGEVERLESLIAEGGRRLIEENMRANAAERRVAELEAALRPLADATFAEFCDESTEEMEPDDAKVRYPEDTCEITFGMIRDAQKALRQEKPE